MPKIFSVRFNNNVELQYLLHENEDSHAWSNLVQNVNINNLRVTKQNERRGFSTQAEVNEAVQRLNYLCGTFSLPGLDLSSDIPWNKQLNIIHTYFPTAINKPCENSSEWHEVNLTVHWLEHELGNHLHHKDQYLMNADFNHTPSIWIQQHLIRQRENFSPYLEFGTLHNHYIYIGRHFLEMADANDFECDRSHFVPQYRVNATFGMCFSEPQDWSSLIQRHRAYYELRGGIDFWRIPFESKNLVNGYHQLGTLFGRPYETVEQRNDIRTVIANASIADWSVSDYCK